MKKIVIIAVAVVLCVAAVLVYIMRGDITGKLIQARVESALEKSPFVESWTIEKTSYKDGRFDMTGLELLVNGGGKIRVASISADGIDREAKTAEMLVISGVEFSNKILALNCVMKEAAVDKPDFSETQAQIDEGNYFTFMGYEHAMASDMRCTAANGVVFSMASYDLSGPVAAGKTPATQTASAKDITVRNPMTQFKIPNVTVTTAYDEASKTMHAKYEPMEVEGLFTLNMEFELADFDAVEMNKKFMNDPTYAEETELTVAYAYLKFDDKGAAKKMFDALAAITGMSPGAAKGMIVTEIASSTAFEEMFQNGAAIKSALLDYINNSRSIEIVMDPVQPVTISLGTLGSGDSLDFLDAYNLSISVNGRPRVKIQ